MGLLFYLWSRTAASNATADSAVNWQEGQAPSSVNDSGRAMMASTAAYRDDISGAIVTGGTSTAYTVTSYEIFDTLAHMNGAMIAFTPHVTNGDTVTLNVDGLGAKPLRGRPSVEIPSNSLILGTPYVATYNNSDAVWYLQGGSPGAYIIPLGSMLQHTVSTTPNSAFVFPFGQALSRTTFVTYFNLVGTTYGIGDGSTTFNAPDERGRLDICPDNMGGSAANRMTGLVLGGSGGNTNGVATIAQANLPNVTLAVTGTVVTASSAAVYKGPIGSAAGFVSGGGGPVNWVDTTATSSTLSSSSANSGGSISLTAASINGNTTQTTLATTMPYLGINKILRVI